MADDDLRAHLEIDSKFENIELVQVVLEERLESLSFDEDTCHWIGIAMREAVANAIKHGNQRDPTKAVMVDIAVENGSLVIRVEDQGEGFDLALLDNPLSPENLLKPSGRGIFYMRSFMDDIIYTFRPGGGTIVTLRKRLGTVPAANQSQGGER
jgi:serine/threonine-protein kinase RsbW